MAKRQGAEGITLNAEGNEERIVDPNEPRVSGAQQRAAKFREASASRKLRVPEGKPPAKLHTFEVSSANLETLQLVAEDESEAVRQFCQCHGLYSLDGRAFVKYVGEDTRPKPGEIKATTP